MLNKGAKAQAVRSIGQAQTHSTIKVQISTQNLTDNQSIYPPNHLSLYYLCPTIDRSATHSRAHLYPISRFGSAEKTTFCCCPQTEWYCCRWQQWVYRSCCTSIKARADKLSSKCRWFAGWNRFCSQCERGCRNTTIHTWGGVGGSWRREPTQTPGEHRIKENNTYKIYSLDGLQCRRSSPSCAFYLDSVWYCDVFSGICSLKLSKRAWILCLCKHIKETQSFVCLLLFQGFLHDVIHLTSLEPTYVLNPFFSRLAPSPFLPHIVRGLATQLSHCRSCPADSRFSPFPFLIPPPTIVQIFNYSLLHPWRLKGWLEGKRVVDWGTVERNQRAGAAARGCRRIIKHRFGMMMKTATTRQTRGLRVRRP